MSEVADRFVVVLDANVLYPFLVRDVLLRFAEAGLYRARWSMQILDEWTNALVANKPGLKASVLRARSAMTKAFPEAIVDGHEHLIPTLKLPDENDRHVLAAAIVSGAQHIITENLRDFPSEALSPFDIEAVSADQFLYSTFELYPGPATLALRKMREDYRNPALSRSELIIELLRVGLPQTASLAKSEIERI